MTKRNKRGDIKTSAEQSESADSVPEISQFRNLDETERAVAHAIIEKLPGDSWDHVAERLGISRRQLFNLRQHGGVQEVVCNVSKALLKVDATDVFKALSAKAKSGDTSAMRLFFELTGEFRESSVEKTDKNPEDFYNELLEHAVRIPCNSRKAQTAD